MQISRYLLLIIFIALMGTLVSCSDHEHSQSHEHQQEEQNNGESSVYYTCSMHPEIKESEPGRCPICHMNLTKVEVDEEEDESFSDSGEEKVYWQCENFPDVQSETPGPCPLDGTDMVKVDMRESAGESVARVRLRHAQLDHFEPSFFVVSPMKMQKKSRFLGTVLQAEEKEGNIAARVEGRVENVYVRSTGAHVRQGDLLLDIYSPKLISAGEEYLIAKRNHENRPSETTQSLLNQSEERLRLWGIQKSQYQNWVQENKVPDVIKIYSSMTGIVTQRSANPGRYFNEGESFFDIVDLSTVWLEIDVYEADSGLVEMGQKVDISFNALPGKTWEGVIDFINPVINPQTRTLKVRVTLDNEQGRLRPGMTATAVISIDLGDEKLVIPRPSLIDTGRRQVVWKRVSERTYQAILVKAGHQTQGYVQILEGLDEGDEIVLDGNFLLDAQAQIFGGYEEFRGSDKTSTDVQSHH